MQGDLHVAVAFSLAGGRERAERMATVIAQAAAPVGADPSRYGGYAAVTTHSFIIFDARIAARVQSWAGGQATSGQWQTRAFGLDHNTVPGSWLFFEGELKDDAEALRPFLMRVWEVISVTSPRVLKPETNAGTSIPYEAQLALESKGGNVVYVVNLLAEAGKPVAPPKTPLLELEGQRTPTNRGQRALTPPNVFEGVVLSCGCGKGFPSGLDERLGAKITRSVPAAAGAEEASMLFLTGASGEVMGVSALDGGSHYIPGKVDISVLLPDGAAAPTEDCRLKAIVDATVASCKIGQGRGSRTVGCGPLTGVELESTEYTITKLEGSRALHVHPELPVGTHRVQLINYYKALPVSAEELAREPTLTPVLRQPLSPPEQRVALFPGSVDTGFMCHVGGDSVFLEGAYGRDKSNSKWPLITHWCDRICMSTPGSGALRGGASLRSRLAGPGMVTWDVT